MSQAHQREVAIFDAALQLPPREREGYLQQTCGSDLELLARVRALLDADERQTDFLAPASTVEISPAPSEKPGDRIGPYKLLQLIGEGGCGVVYMAEQDKPIRRRVALKIIKLGMDTKQVIARFEAERQALALMDHPNIAKVHDAGATATGRPYFVMELVRGVKITDYCDDKKLQTRQRLELFIQVCQAVQHAHQKGIIHRDLKPSNILVTVNDGLAVVKVIDFGIAKATTGERLTDKTVFTAFEQFIGTPAYMSPEQAEISSVDIDTRSDIYSLGVLLYELLTGQTPFDAKELLRAGLDEMRRTLREQEPSRPSTRLSTLGAQELTNAATERGLDAPRLTSLLRGDLDWIVMKCLEKDRARRYETANGLAMDIQRHLNNEAVVASPPSGLYRFRKLVRRNKVAFGTVGVISATLVMAVVVSSWEAVRARRAEHKQGIEAAKSRQVARFLETMLESVGPSVAMGRDTAMLREILNETAEQVKDLTSQPEVEIELRTVLAETYLSLELPHEAEKIADEGLKRARLVYGEKSLATTRLLTDIGTAKTQLSDINGAVDCLQSALTIQRQVLPSGHLDIANTLEKLADALRILNRNAESVIHAQEALAIKKQHFGSRDPALLSSLNSLGLALSNSGRLSQAEDVFKEALLIAPKESPAEALALSRLGWTLGKESKLPDAEDNLRKAVDIDMRIVGSNSWALAWDFYYLGYVLRRESNLSEAEVDFRKALDIEWKHWRDRPWAAKDALNGVVGVLMQAREYKEADEVFDRLITPEVFAQPQSAGFLQAQASHFAQRGCWQKAVESARKLVELQPTDHANYHVLAPVLAAMGNTNGYRQLCQRITAQFSTATDPLIADRMAKDCLILPNSGADLVLVGKMAQTAVDAGARRAELPYFECTKALAEYRQGHFASAAKWAQRSIDDPHYAGARARFVEAYMVLAMARFELKQKQPCEDALAEGLEQADKLEKLEHGDLGSAWRDWIIARALLAEAKELITGPTRDTGQNLQSKADTKRN